MNKRKINLFIVKHQTVTRREQHLHADVILDIDKMTFIKNRFSEKDLSGAEAICKFLNNHRLNEYFDFEWEELFLNYLNENLSYNISNFMVNTGEYMNTIIDIHEEYIKKMEHILTLTLKKYNNTVNN